MGLRAVCQVLGVVSGRQERLGRLLWRRPAARRKQERDRLPQEPRGPVGPEERRGRVLGLRLAARRTQGLDSLPREPPGRVVQVELRAQAVRGAEAISPVSWK